MDNFAELIINARKKQKLSIEGLSKLSGVPGSSIYNYEIGVQPTLAKADKLLRALGIKLVIGGIENEIV